jgi:QueF-like protein
MEAWAAYSEQADVASNVDGQAAAESEANGAWRAHLPAEPAPRRRVRRWLIESKSLKFYLASFRDQSGFHEECTIAIGKRTAACLDPAYLRIGGMTSHAHSLGARRRPLQPATSLPLEPAEAGTVKGSDGGAGARSCASS